MEHQRHQAKARLRRQQEKDSQRWIRDRVIARMVKFRSQVDVTLPAVLWEDGEATAVNTTLHFHGEMVKQCIRAGELAVGQQVASVGAPEHGVADGIIQGVSTAEGVAFQGDEPITFNAVSYTHLDVYKRQISVCAVTQWRKI